MKFSKRYTKLDFPVFTTIRKNIGYYRERMLVDVNTPDGKFRAEILSIRSIKKNDITELMAVRDANCSRADLIKMLERWYGTQYDNFILITLGKIYL